MNETNDAPMNPGEECTQPPPGTPVYEKRRYLVVLTGESFQVAHAVSGLLQWAMDYTVANVLAVNADAAEYWAQEHFSKKGLLPLAAWSVAQLKVMTKNLERSVLNSKTSVRRNRGASWFYDAAILKPEARR